jgi:putative NADH-flavin reductase
MTITLFGGTGMIGARILDELSNRHHAVKAVLRDVSKIPDSKWVTTVRGDIFDPKSVFEVSIDSDAVVCAYGPGPENPSLLVEAYKSVLEGLADTGVSRLISVGGAGSLEVAPGVRLIDSPGFPPAWKGIAQAHVEVLEMLRESSLQWTSVSPAAMIEPGPRTGKFRLADDQLVVDEQGQSRISTADYAIAVVDEVEQNAHVRARFTVGY